MSLWARNQGFLVRYTIDDFAKEFLKDVFFGILIWVLCRLGRMVIKWSKPYLRESMSLLKLIYHYCAMRLGLERPWRFLILYFKYVFRQNVAHSHIAADIINRFLT